MELTLARERFRDLDSVLNGVGRFAQNWKLSGCHLLQIWEQLIISCKRNFLGFNQKSFSDANCMKCNFEENGCGPNLRVNKKAILISSSAC